MTFQKQYNEYDVVILNYLFNEEIYNKCHEILYAQFLLNEAYFAQRSELQTLFSQGGTQENIANQSKVASYENFTKVVKEMHEYLKL